MPENGLLDRALFKCCISSSRSVCCHGRNMMGIIGRKEPSVVTKRSQVKSKRILFVGYELLLGGEQGQRVRGLINSCEVCLS